MKAERAAFVELKNMFDHLSVEKKSHDSAIDQLSTQLEQKSIGLQQVHEEMSNLRMEILAKNEELAKISTLR